MLRNGHHNVTEVQTDGRTTYDSNTALALRAPRGNKSTISNLHTTAVTASQSMRAGQFSMRTMASQLLQLLHALPSGPVVPFVLIQYYISHGTA